MKVHLAILFLATICVSTASAQVKSVYTSTRTGACRTIASDETGAGSYEGECPGVGGYKIRLIEGDIRQTINIITPAKKKFELNFWNFYSSFSSIGEKVEWRTKKNVPIALIARYNVSDPEESQKSTSYLVVSKIGPTQSCVIDFIPPGPQQNVEARKVADEAQTKPCRSFR